MITEWRQVQNSTYRKQEVAADLGTWKSDLLSRQYRLQKVIVNPVGGLIAAVLRKVDDASVVLKVYTALGSLVSECKWTYACHNVIDGRWISCKEFVFAFQDGIIRVYDISCFAKPFAYTLTKKQIRLCGICPRGVVAVVGESQVLWFDLTTKETTPWKFTPALVQGAGGKTGIKFIDIYNRQDELYAVLINGDGAVHQVWPNGCRLIRFTSNGAETTSSVFISFAFSWSGTFGAFRTDDGFLVIATLTGMKLRNCRRELSSQTSLPDSDLTTESTGQGSSISLSVTVVSTPTLLVDQMIWLGDHCVGMTSKTPTLNNPNQCCLFIGGPSSKWIDLLFSTPVILVGGQDLKYLCYSAIGIIQYACPETLKTYSPGSCHTASMICFALDDGQTSDMGSQFSAVGPGNESSSSEWDDDTCDEINRLEESMKKRLSDARLVDKQDLNYLFFRKKWTQKKRRRKENDAIGFIASLSPTERYQSLQTLLKAIRYEYNVKNIIVALKAIRLILQYLREHSIESADDAANVDFSCYYRLVRDFRMIQRIKINLEVLITYEEFLDLRLTRLIDLCQRDYKLCLKMCSTYDMSSGCASNKRHLDEPLQQINRYIEIQKSKLLLYTLANALATNSESALESCVDDMVKQDKFPGVSIEGVRSAAWACLKYNKKEVGSKILQAHETSKNVLLFFFRLVDDCSGIIRYAQDHDDTDSVDYWLYLKCQNIFNLYATKTVPARFHLNQLTNLLDAERAGNTFYRQDSQLVLDYVTRCFLRNGHAVTDLPSSSAQVMFMKLNSEVSKIFEESTPSVASAGSSTNQNTSTTASNTGSSFLTNLIIPRSFMKDNKKAQLQKSLSEIRKIATLIDQKKKTCMFFDPKQGLLDYADFIEYQTFNAKATLKDYVVSLLTRNLDSQLKDTMAKFLLPPLIVRLWKLECLAANNAWPVFCECAIQAIRSVSIDARLKRINAGTTNSTGAAFNLFNLNNPFNAASRGNNDEDVISRLLRGSNQDSASVAGLTHIIGSVLSSKPDQSTATFIPLLPSSLTNSGQSADLFCPNTIPVASYNSVPVVDFVTVAKSFDKENLALCLAPYIHSHALRDKWCSLLGLRTQADQFSKNAILCAVSRSGKKNVGGDYQLFVQTVKKAVEDRRLVNSSNDRSTITS